MRSRPAAPPPVDSLRSDWQTPAAEESFSLPVIQNFVGTVQAAWGPAGVQNWHAPPTALPTPIGQLYRLDPAAGTAAVRRVDPAGTCYQVAAAELVRRHPVVSATTRLTPPAAIPDPITGADLIERLTFRLSGTYAIVFGGLCRVWGYGSYWNLPPEDVPQFNVVDDGATIVITDNKTFGRAVVRGGAGASEQTYRRLDDLYAGRPSSGPGRLAAFVITVEAGDTFNWTARQGVEPVIMPPDPDEVDDNATVDAWEEVWRSAFTDNDDHFSGALPAITFDDPELDRLYYAGILALIHGRRTFRDLGPRARFATGGQAIWTEDREPLRVGYTTGATDGAATTSFLWELHQAAPLLSRLDPVVLRQQLELFLRVGVDRNWGVELLTGQGVGMWYGINDGAIVAAAADYLAGTGDLTWLDRSIGDATVRERLLRHVARHRELAAGARFADGDDLAGGGDLADYGGAHNVLECVSSYEHGVASFNALAAWCHRFAARVLDSDRAAEHEAAADRIELAVLGLFAGGPFRCRTPSGDREVRTCLDFIYVGRYLTDALDAPTRAAMLGFFTSELATEDWMRALSPADPDSLTTELPEFQTFRADHQSTGAYGGWPGLSADVRLRFGDHDATLAWLRRISRVTREGPFGQAYWVGLPDAPAEPARKASFFNGNCSMLISGCTLSTALLDHLDPDWR